MALTEQLSLGVLKGSASRWGARPGSNRKYHWSSSGALLGCLSFQVCSVAMAALRDELVGEWWWQRAPVVVKSRSYCRSVPSLSRPQGMVTAGLGGSDLPLLSGLIFSLSDRITLSGNTLNLQGTLHPKVILKINYKWELKAPPHTVNYCHWTFWGSEGERSDVKSRRYPQLLALGLSLVLELREQNAERQAWGWGKLQVKMCLPEEAFLGKESKWKTMEK